MTASFELCINSIAYYISEKCKVCDVIRSLDFSCIANQHSTIWSKGDVLPHRGGRYEPTPVSILVSQVEEHTSYIIYLYTCKCLLKQLSVSLIGDVLPHSQRR